MDTSILAHISMQYLTPKKQMNLNAKQALY